MKTYEVALTKGHVLRHAPTHSAHGVEAALIDIAQDLLLRHLADEGVTDLIALKGGTALRKFYAGARGRFSTDLDFSVSHPDDDLQGIKELIEGAMSRWTAAAVSSSNKTLVRM